MERNTYFAQIFEQKIKAWCKTNKSTQQEFCNKVGITPNMITRYKQGKAYPTKEVLEIMCSVLGCNANDFIPVVKKHIRKPYESFVEAIKDKSRQLLLETAVIKLGYRTGTKYHSFYENGRSIEYETLGQVRDPSQDMHIRPYKIVLGNETGKTGISAFNNRPYEIIEYYGVF